MNRIFLGKPIHWLIVAAIAALGWGAGRIRLHVTDFNFFVILTILVVIVALVAVIATTRPGDRVTRDRIEDD